MLERYWTLPTPRFLLAWGLAALALSFLGGCFFLLLVHSNNNVPVFYLIPALLVVAVFEVMFLKPPVLVALLLVSTLHGLLFWILHWLADTAAEIKGAGTNIRRLWIPALLLVPYIALLFFLFRVPEVP